MKESKLIRDKIPEIIRNSGRIPVIHTANDMEYKEKLRQKLQEEVVEFLESGDVVELIDILEIIYSIGLQMGVSIDEIENLRKRKAEQNGAFGKKVVLDAINTK